MMFTALYHTHKLVVILFLLIYLIKTILLLIGRHGALDKFSRFILIPEIIISVLFLATGGVLALTVANIGFLWVLKIIFVLVAIPLALIGFKKKKKLLGFIAFVLIVGAYGLAEANKAYLGKRKDFKDEVITKVDAPNYSLSLHGKALYNAQCAICHGADGTAGLSGASNLPTSQFTNEEIRSIIANGKNTMPKMGGKYSEQELTALIQYVKELRIR